MYKQQNVRKLKQVFQLLAREGGHVADGAPPCSGGSALWCPALVLGTGMRSLET